MVDPQHSFNKFLDIAWSIDKSFGAESSYQLMIFQMVGLIF